LSIRSCASLGVIRQVKPASRTLPMPWRDAAEFLRMVSILETNARTAGSGDSSFPGERSAKNAISAPAAASATKATPAATHVRRLRGCASATVRT
jgi:hypothetical protein